MVENHIEQTLADPITVDVELHPHGIPPSFKKCFK